MTYRPFQKFEHACADAIQRSVNTGYRGKAIVNDIHVTEILSVTERTEHGFMGSDVTPPDDPCVWVDVVFRAEQYDRVQGGWWTRPEPYRWSFRGTLTDVIKELTAGED